MQVEESLNRVAREMRRAKERWPDLDTDKLLRWIVKYDGEVECELKNLIQAIQEEQQSEQPVTEMG